VIARAGLAAFTAVVMLVAGTATYLVLGTRTSHVAAPPEKPTQATPSAKGFSLPGTLYLAQDGALYSLAIGRFHQLTPEAGWMQPSLTPNGADLLAVKRAAEYSDVYELTRFGNVVKRLTGNAAAKRTDTGANHWSFYPRLSADGKTLWMAYDQPKFGYDVVFSVWAVPFGASVKSGRLWTNADDYTGGDVQPIPVRTGMIYTKYSYGPDQRLVGQLWFTNRAYSYGTALTTPGEDCRTPSVSPSGTQIAMVCTYEQQVSYLAIASWNGRTLGPRRIVLRNQLVAQPTWAPNGAGIAYLAPGVANGPFQLWWLPAAAYTPPAPSPTPSAAPGATPSQVPTPSAPPSVKPIQLTVDDGFDATSPMAWGS
jgi:hypothetical protein